ncbi:unnamed protein product [Pieris brassicae]|uniref:Uncharacterized protein n=1 Tax=Pieris brassicae TaxID=7116 RepID=A0A9P0TP48_PIEBR|nr:unnamed protein product [Pieris brassicae]
MPNWDRAKGLRNDSPSSPQFEESLLSTFHSLNVLESSSIPESSGRKCPTGIGLKDYETTLRRLLNLKSLSLVLSTVFMCLKVVQFRSHLEENAQLG